MSDGAGTPADPDIEAVLIAWRQGDCTLAKTEVVFADVVGLDDTQADGPFHVVAREVHGLVVLSQTCDIVQARTESYVQVAPLVEVDAAHLHQIARRRRIQYALVPRLEGRRLVADLGRVMTITRELLATLPRTDGCGTDDERREFSKAVGRKFTRAAFPDDFVRMVERLRKRVLEKHDRESPEGEVLRGLWDIRVVASPDWEADAIEILLLFVCEQKVPGDAYEWMEKWVALVAPSGRFITVRGHVATLDDLTARDYVVSDPLDFEQLSGTTSPE